MRKVSLKFRHWIVAINVVLVLLMTGTFLVVALGKFQSLAETTADEKFGLLADKVFYEIKQTFVQERRYVEMVGATDIGWAGTGESRSKVSADALIPTLIQSLNAVPSRYSVYFGLPEDGFLQVIGVRADPRIIAALKAPANTHMAVRVIRKLPNGKRLEQWTYRSAEDKTLGQFQQPASYRPSTRPWYQGAMAQQRTFMTDPYRFASTGDLGLSVAALLRDKQGAFGVDLSLQSFEGLLQSLNLSPNGAVVVVDADHHVLAFRSNGPLYGQLPKDRVAKLTESGNKYLDHLAALGASVQPNTSGRAQIADQPFVLSSRIVEPVPGKAYRVYVFAPLSDFTAVVERTRIEVVIAAALLLVVLVPLALSGTKQVSKSLMALAHHSERVQKLDFSTKPEHVESFLYEVNALGRSQEVMHDSLEQRTLALEHATKKLAQLVDIGIRMGREKERAGLLRDVLNGAKAISNAAACTLFIRTEQDTLRLGMHTGDDTLPVSEIPIFDPHTGQPLRTYVSSYAVATGETVVIDNVDTDTRFDLTTAKRNSAALGVRAVSLLTVPLVPREGQAIGVLALSRPADPLTGKSVPFDADTVGFIEALASQATVALENQNLLQAQQDFLDAMIKILAGAIDAKSPYTGGHCLRVPELAFMLAEAAGKVSEGPLADFAFTTEDQWREFRIGAWLHDCGKVTTPEYVVDKATKLETIYNRIHEVRTRFEVLLRDAQITAYQRIAQGEEASVAWQSFEERQQQLHEDFALVAQINLGEEFMAPEKLERMRAIAGQTWVRHFDDRLGLAHEELKRYGGAPAPALPTQEQLLSDKAHHIVPRGVDRVLDPKFGFQVTVPEHLYNYGEIHNLSVGRGTLTAEERFKINEHIIQTIVMLDKLPFPKHLRRVPEYAGTHHETLIGTGYPKKLSAAELSVPARIMAIADIFEALTASDRPYKKAKSLSESIKILSFFKKDQHIDPHLFDLFLTSGVYLHYAKRFLHPDQIDHVDVAAFVG